MVLFAVGLKDKTWPSSLVNHFDPWGVLYIEVPNSPGVFKTRSLASALYASS